MMNILYEVHGNLYVNLTNRCPCACIFCLRQTREEMEHSGSLWLDREPTVEETEKEFEKFPVDTYGEIVFCGFGEPTQRLEDMLRIAKFIKTKYKKSIRVNTNGLGSLINGRDIAPDFAGLVDTVSVSLNTPDADKYLALTRSKFGRDSFQAVLDFTREVKKHVPNVVMTTVDTTLTSEEVKKCRELCDALQVAYRIRPWED